VHFELKGFARVLVQYRVVYC